MTDDRPNILLVVLDTVRAQNLSLYGHDRRTTPFLEQFGKKSITYQRSYSPAPWTTPSHASIFTGTYVTGHQTNRSNERLNPDLPTLAELLSKSGYETVGFSNNGYASPRFGFDRGFDRFRFNLGSYNEPLDGGVAISDIRRNVGDGNFLRKSLEALRFTQQAKGSLTKTTINWLYRKASEADLLSKRDRGAVATNRFVNEYLQQRENDDKPFFLFLNYMEAHAPYQAPEKFRNQYVDNPSTSDWNSQADYFGQRVPDQQQKLSDLEDQYDGCIRYLDAKLENLMEILHEHNFFEDSLIVITSDHGEAFGENGFYEHKTGVYDELTHVPLIINTPSDDDRTIQTPVSNRWLFSTVLKSAGGTVPDHAVSADLLKPSTKPVVIESEDFPYDDSVFKASPLAEKFKEPQQGLVDERGEYKLVHFDFDDSVELYAIGDEQTNIVSVHPEEAESIRKKLDQQLTQKSIPVRSDVDEPVEIDEETRKHLQELGYR